MNYLTRFVGSLVVVLGLAPQAAWADPITRSGTYTMEHGGITRTFRVHVPRGYKAGVAAPLVLIFHGWGGNENEFLGSKTVTSLADKRGYILVAPRGLGSGAPDNSNNSWSFSGSSTGLDGDGVNPEVPGDTNAICGGNTPDYSYSSCKNPDGPVASNTCSWTQCQADDVDFVRALVAYLKANLGIDARNIFATGGSNGGMFTWELGQNPVSAPLFRAIAPLIGLPHRGYLDAQGNLDGGELPVLVITGTRDTTVPPGDWEDESFTTTSNGSDRYYYTGATAITQVWAVANGCEFSGDAVPFDDGIRKTDCRTYCSGGSGWPKVLDCRARMGHTYSLSWAWPLIMNFFDAHSG
jgi:polyhydroxybutyrate depolymerase